MAGTKTGTSPSRTEKRVAPAEQFQRFLEAAREHGCDPADPRIPDVLRGMAARPHQPRRKSGGKVKAKDAATET